MSWQETILGRLRQRDQREGAHAALIEDYKRLAQTTRMLKERNAALLTATISAKQGSSNSTEANPVQAAYVASLEGNISSLRDELSQLYKTQSQNAQKLLDLSEKLRETEDRSRDATEQTRSLRLDSERLSRRLQDAVGAIKEKERAIQTLNDELATAQLEYTQLERKNADLQQDNKNLLQRWLDRMSDEAAQMNEANAFLESTSRLRAESQAAQPTTPKSPRTPRASLGLAASTSNLKASRSATPTRSRPASRPPSPTHSVRSTSSRVSRAPRPSAAKAPLPRS